MKRYRNGEIWEFEGEVPVARAAGGVILGVDGGTTSTVCVCLAASAKFPDAVAGGGGDLPDPLPVLARAVAGCSNHNSVGGQFGECAGGECLCGEEFGERFPSCSSVACCNLGMFFASVFFLSQRSFFVFGC